MGAELPPEIRLRISHGVSRMRANAALRAVCLWCFGVVCFQVLVELADRLLSLTARGIAPEAIMIAALALGAPYVIASVFSRRITRPRAALIADERLGLKCRLSTAVALEKSGDPSFAEKFLDEARASVGSLDVSPAFPTRVPRIVFFAVIPVALIVAIRAYVPYRDLLGWNAQAADEKKQQENMAKAAAKFETKVEDLKRKIEDQKADGEQELPQARRLERMKEIEKLLKDVKTGELDKREALVAIGDLKRDIEKDRKAAAKQELVKELAEKMAELGGKGDKADDPESADLAKDIAGQLQKGDTKAAAEKLLELKEKIENAEKQAAAGKNPEELKKLRKELEKFAEALAQAQDLSGKLSEMAELAGEFESQLSKEDLDRLREMTPRDLRDQLERLLTEACADMENLGENQGDGEDDEGEGEGEDASDEVQSLEEMEELLDELSDELAQGDQPGGDKGDKQGQGQAQGQGQGQGQGQDQGKGGKPGGQKAKKLGGKKGGKGSKSGKGSGQGKGAGKGQGQGKGGQQQGQGNQQGGAFGGPGQGAGGKAPERDTSVGFEPTKIKGQMGPGAITSLQHFRGRGAKNQAPEGFVQAAESARQDAVRALERERIPTDAKDLVKNYFDQIDVKNPPKGPSQ